jgi:polysaccharide export outer membrane protein
MIRVAELEETPAPSAPIHIDPSGNIDLPLIGPVHAAGLTTSELRVQLIEKYKKYIHEPTVSVSVTEFHSQPVTVVGAVKNPGVHQIEGPKRLLELISMAGGLTDEAGSKVTITRDVSAGPLPLAGARTDLGGKFTVGDVDLLGLMASTHPSSNVLIRPNDVISVSTANLVYVMGEVKKPGGYTLHTHTTMSLLEALAMAEGPLSTARPSHGRVLRLTGEGQAREEIPVDVSKMLNGKAADMPLQAYDILVIPNNVPRAASLRAIEAAVQLGTGVLIYHGLR